ncbi:hypothetical protein BDZ97DRAFT_1668069, partial [Flammula alnicola]
LGGREFKWKPNALDYQEYELRRNTLFGAPLGRVFRMMGGIMGRLAEDHVSVEAVLQGPCYFNKVIATLEDGYVLAEDDIPMEYQDIVSGVYRVNASEKGGTVSICSWWPRLIKWEGCGYDMGQWLPDAEKMYQDRLANIRCKPEDFPPRTSTKWKQMLKFYSPKSKRVMEPGRKLAEKVLQGFFEALRKECAAAQPYKRQRIR